MQLVIDMHWLVKRSLIQIYNTLPIKILHKEDFWLNMYITRFSASMTKLKYYQVPSTFYRFATLTTPDESYSRKQQITIMLIQRNFLFFTEGIFNNLLACVAAIERRGREGEGARTRTIPRAGTHTWRLVCTDGNWTAHIWIRMKKLNAPLFTW